MDGRELRYLTFLRLEPRCKHAFIPPSQCSPYCWQAWPTASQHSTFVIHKVYCILPLFTCGILLMQVRARLAVAKGMLQHLQTHCFPDRSAMAQTRTPEDCRNLSGPQALAAQVASTFSQLPQRTPGSSVSIRAASDHGLAKQAQAQAPAAGMHFGDGIVPKGEDELQKLCAICMEHPIQVLFEPCHHAIACATCAAKVATKTKECPVCRSPLVACTQLCTLAHTDQAISRPDGA